MLRINQLSHTCYYWMEHDGTTWSPYRQRSAEPTLGSPLPKKPVPYTALLGALVGALETIQKVCGCRASVATVVWPEGLVHVGSLRSRVTTHSNLCDRLFNRITNL